MSKVTIIITTYRHQDFIEHTMKSIFCQTYENRELLIWDDSPDNLTRDIMQKYVKQYPQKIKAWHHNPSKHIVWNLNYLLWQKDKNSEYIAFLEWDDLRHSDYLSEKIKIFQNFPNVWLVYNDISIIDKNWSVVEKNRISSRTRKRYKNETDTIWKLLSQDMICFSYSTLMSRNFDWLVIRNWGNKELLWSETDFWLQIAKKHNLYGIEKDLTYYRKHWNNSSSNLDTTIKHFTFLIDIYLRDWQINHKDYKKIKILIYLMLSFNAIKQYKHKEFFMNIINAFNISLIKTLHIWLNSLYYRFIKPLFFNLLNHIKIK